MYCSGCGHRFDECNESQTVCGRCGGSNFSDYFPVNLDPFDDDDFDFDDGSDALDDDLAAAEDAANMLAASLGAAENVGEKAARRR